MKKSVIIIGAPSNADAMEYHVADGFQENGWDPHIVDCRHIVGRWKKIDAYLRLWLKVVLREPERILERRIVKSVKRIKPQLVVVIQGSEVSPKTVRKIKKNTNSRVVAWCQDAIVNYKRQYVLSGVYDHIFLKDMYMVEMLKNIVGITNVSHLHEACNPSRQRPVSVGESDLKRFGCDIGVYGTLYYYRQRFLESLIDFDLKVWGKKPVWMENSLGSRWMGGEVDGEDKWKAIQCAKINLNLMHYGEICSVNSRLFEIAAAGGFQICSYSPGIASVFSEGVEIVVFRTKRELLDMLDWYLGRGASEREVIAKAARKRVFRDHTYASRVREIVKISAVSS